MESVLAIAIGGVVACFVFLGLRFAFSLEQDSQVATKTQDEIIPATESLARPPARDESTRDTDIPKCVAFLDVETTGLTDKDRIVTLAGVKLLNSATLAAGSMQLAYIHLVFDPGRKSHPRAEAVHGYSDWTLRHQEPFEVYAETIAEFFDSADLLVAHNAEFDAGFLNREMEALGRSPISKPVYCTMQAYREKGFVGSASLSSICQKIGIARAGSLHGALEDAWLAMRVYLWLNNCTVSAGLPSQFKGDPTNLRPPPPLPTGPLPRRSRRKASSPVNEPDVPLPSAGALL